MDGLSQPRSASEPAPALEGRVRNEVSLFPLTLVMFLIGTAEVLAGPMMAHMGAHFGVAAARIAWLPASYALVYASAAPLFGPLSDRVRRKTLLVPALLSFGAGQLLIALSAHFALAVFGSCIAGLSAALMAPNALALVRDSVDADEQATAAGRAFRGLTFSFVSVPVIGAQLAHRYDWRAAYGLLAAAAWLAALLVARMAVRPAAPSTERAGGFVKAVRDALRIHGVRSRLAVSFFWLGLSIGNITLLAEVLRRRFDLSTEQVGWLVGAFGLTTMLGNSLIDTVLRRVNKPRRIVVCSIVATIVGCSVVGVFATALNAFTLLAGFIWALAYGLAGPIHHASLGVAAPQACGTVYALQASLLNTGIMLVGFAAGRYFDSFGVEWVFGGTLVGMLLGLVLVPRRY